MHQKDRNVHTTGMIFRKTPFKETSLILEVFTHELGKFLLLPKASNEKK